ncbi:MAG: hypothetical protein KDA05_11485 [Phycisphaerales bacterium]|nr:hypothetical protein [Phycisphaerales bacterium]MCB9841398.1 hypothetical protein [Phycisphaeraceae bacterium]
MPSGNVQPGPAKMCVVCRRDCAGRPRTKDAAGRYVCIDCVERIKVRRAAEAAVLEPDPIDPANEPVDITTSLADDTRPAPRPGASDHRNHPPAEPEDSGIIPLASDDGLGPAASGLDAPRTCPNCSILLARHAVICTACGYDTRSGHLLAGPDEGGPKCVSCGYSLKGIKNQRCPECGTLNTRQNKRALAEAKAARDVVREAYTKPLIMFGVGLAISVVAAMIGAGSLSAGFTATAAYLIAYAIYVPLGVAVFLLCCLVWLGFDAPIHLIALRLAAVYAVTDAVGVFVAFIPLGIIQMAIIVIVHVGLLQDMLELDLTDAILVGLLTFGARLIIFLFAVAWISGLFA